MEIIKKIGVIVGIITGITIVVSTIAGWIVSAGYLLRYGGIIDKTMRFTEREIDDYAD